MQNIRKSSRTGRLVLAIAIAGSLAVAQALPAFADPDTPPNPSSTTMSLKIDGTQIVAEVPTDLTIAVKGDGTFVAPANVHLENQSVFAVHVSKVKATVADSPKFTLVAKDAFDTASDDDTLWMTVKAGTHDLDLSTAAVDAGVEPQVGQWNMKQADASSGTGDDVLALTLAGAVKNAKSLKTDSAATALTVQWTLAAGEATVTPGP